jgi:hypothetical protein
MTACATTHSYATIDFPEVRERPRIGGNFCAAAFQRRPRDGGRAVFAVVSLASNSCFPETETARCRDRFAYAMNCSAAKSSIRCTRLRSSSRAGGATATRSGQTNQATNHQIKKCSYQRFPRGRLRYVDRLRRPPWTNRHAQTNIQTGPLSGGRSSASICGRLPCDRDFQRPAEAEAGPVPAYNGF